jgi:hypothetical protein
MSGEEKDEIAAVASPFAKASGDKALPRKDRVGSAEEVGKDRV